MAYRFSGTTSYVQFAISPFTGYTFGPITAAIFLKLNVATGTKRYFSIENTSSSNIVQLSGAGSSNPPALSVGGGTVSTSALTMTSTSVWYLLVATASGSGSPARFHIQDGTSWTHADAALSLSANQAIGGTDKLYVSSPADFGGGYINADVVCAGIKKASSTDLQVETLSRTSFGAWTAFGFDWLVGFDTSFESASKLQDQASPGTGDEVTRSGVTTGVTDPPGWSFVSAVTPVADFTGTPLTAAVSTSVAFTDASTNTPTSWAWTFGDGGTSTSQNPTHSYAATGTYTVALTATNATGSNTMTKTAYVTVVGSLSQNPTHVYANPGVYTVTLTATNAAGSDTKTRTGYVTVNAPFVPQIIWLTPAPLTGAPAAPTFESATSYSTVANRPAVTGTTRPFASSAALTGALNAASPGDLVLYTGAGVLDISGNYAGFCGRRYTGYVNIDLGLPGSANHVRFTGGGGAGLPAVAIYNSAFLRIYGGEITNPAPKTVGYDGLHIYGAQNPGNGSTNHIVWWNLLVHDTVDSGIKMLPNVVSGGGNAADNTIADCDIQAEVYRIGLDKSVDTSHAERGTGQHCCLLADTDPAGATYPSFLRNRVAIDGHDTGLTSSQGGGSVIELGFNDAASTISGCTLILRGANTMFNAQQQTGGNGLNLWGDAQQGVAIPFLQHSNATGSAVCNPGGQNRPGVVVAYGRHANTNQNAYEGTNPWQIGPTYTNVA